MLLTRVVQERLPRRSEDSGDRAERVIASAFLENGARSRPERAAAVSKGHTHLFFLASLPSVTDKDEVDRVSSNRPGLKMKSCYLEN